MNMIFPITYPTSAAGKITSSANGIIKNTPKPTSSARIVVEAITAAVTPPKNEARRARLNQPAYTQRRQAAIGPSWLGKKALSVYAEYAATPWTKDLLKLRKRFICLPFICRRSTGEGPLLAELGRSRQLSRLPSWKIHGLSRLAGTDPRRILPASSTN
jgi:hypothetical protein